MSDGGNGALQRVAQAISDGLPVDWKQEETTHPDIKDLLAELRKVEALGRAHGAPVDALLGQVAATAELVVTRGDAGLDMTQLVVSSTWGPLRLLENLGGGGWGQVYRAYDPKLQTEVALKLLRPDRAAGGAARAFLGEARRLARVRHPNVVTVHGADEHDGRPGIWMDFVRGKTIEEILDEQGPFGPQEAAGVGITLCRALAAVHRAGLVHRDVKTTNVMREHGGNIVLMDLGAGAERPADDLELPSEPAAGTPIAMAPEQLRAERVGPAADIYGLGVLLYRLVTGRYPIEADTLSGLRAKHDRREITPLLDLRPDLPVEFVQVVEKALAADPAQRHASAGAMERALAAAMGMHVLEPVPSPVPGRLLTWQGPATAAAALVAVVMGAWFALGPKPRGGSEAVPTVESGAPVNVPKPGDPNGATGPSQSTQPARDQERGEAPQGASGAAGPAMAVTLTVEARLFLEEGGTTRRLLPGASVQPGDKLSLEFQASERTYVYVLNEDATGAVFVLFPVAGLDTENPLAGGVSHRLPGTRGGEAIAWQVTSPGRRESVIIIASREPLADMERAIASFPAASAGEPIAYGEVSRATQVALLRGMGGLAPSQVPGPSGDSGRLAGVLRRLPGASSATSGVWSAVIELSNPGP